MKKFFLNVLIGGVIGAVVATIAFYLPKLILSDLVDRIENSAYDFRMTWVAQNLDEERKFQNPVNGEWAVRPYSDDILLINIDDRSMNKYGVYHKWPRSYQAHLMDFLGEAQAGVVTYDVFYQGADFGEGERDRILNIIQSGELRLGNNADKKLSQTIGKGVNYDQMMVEATRKAGNVIHAIVFNDQNTYPNESDYIERTTIEYQKKMSFVTATKNKLPPSKHLQSKQILDGAFPELANSSHNVAYVNVGIGKNQQDGVQRAVPMIADFNGYLYPSLSLQTILDLMGKRLKDIKIIPEKSLNLGKPFTISRDKEGVIHLSYPFFTTPMLQGFFASGKIINSLTPGDEIDVGGYLKINREKNGSLWGEIRDFEGSPLDITSQTLNDILKSDVWGLKKLKIDEQGMLGGATGIVKTEEDLFNLYELANGQNPLEGISFSTLLNISLIKKSDIAAVPHGESRVVNNSLNISCDENGKLTSPFVFFRDQVIREILDFAPKGLKKIKSGTSVGFGKEMFIPVDEKYRMRLTFLGKNLRTTFREFSFYDIKERRIPPSTFLGKALIIGSSAAAMFDFVNAPVGGNYPGMAIHATAVANILTQKFIIKFPEAYTFIGMILVCILLGMLIYPMKPVYGLITTIVSLLAYFIINVAIMENYGVWVEIIKPLGAIFGIFVGTIIYRYITEEKEKRFLHQTFKAYLSPELIEQMAESKTPPKLGGDVGIRTAYFTDIQSFSTFSEKLSASQLVELLNEYLTKMTDILLAAKGTLDKYEGDAIIAFFGAPMPQEDHALRACRVAIQMQNGLLSLREKWTKEGDKWPVVVHNMRMRIGINSGEIVTGNMGSATRMNYTMMGDSVNLAARLESAAKQYGIFTMMSHFTHNLVKDEVEVRELDRIRVVGKSEPITVFELLAEKNKMDNSLQELMGNFQMGLQAYYNQDWDKSIKAFKESEKMELLRYPDMKTNPSTLKILTCQEYLETPPEKNWDGVSTLTSK